MFFRTKNSDGQSSDAEVAAKYKLALSAIDENVKKLRETKARVLEISARAMVLDRK
jgi:hypothetical protein